MIWLLIIHLASIINFLKDKKKEIKTSELGETKICKKNKTSYLIDIFFVKAVSIKSCVT